MQTTNLEAVVDSLELQMAEAATHTKWLVTQQAPRDLWVCDLAENSAGRAIGAGEPGEAFVPEH